LCLAAGGRAALGYARAFPMRVLAVSIVSGGELIGLHGLKRVI
jgi:hypothetical protein